MARSIITATEAKSAALLDLDIRSSYSGLDYRATGTGTDNVIIVQGDGPEALYTGGHTKIGELIAKAVHGAVTDAISRQNGLLARRPVSQRLYERGLSLKQVAAHVSGAGTNCCDGKIGHNCSRIHTTQPFLKRHWRSVTI